MKRLMVRVREVVAVALAVSVSVSISHAQAGLLTGASKSGPLLQATVTAAPDSPRASYANFVRLANAGDWEAAAQYLSLTAEERPHGALLARRLKLVLDQRLELNASSLSPFSMGDTTDGDYTNDRVGVIPGPNGLPAAVQVSRFYDGNLARWVFSASTVGSIDYWFGQLGAPWLRDRLPPVLMREGPAHVLLWQWIGLAVAIPCLFLLSLALSWLFRGALSKVVARTETEWDDLLLERLRGPFRLWIGAIAATPVLGLLDLNARVSGALNATARGLVMIAFFWALLRAIRLLQERLVSDAISHGQSQARTLVPMLGNFLRVTLVILAVLIALSQFGYQVTSLLAGLGIGGIAVALAGQKTVEHLFGSISLAADRAFRVGDFVRVGTLEGTIERIGLRSTSFRTRERTIVRVPNGKLAEERIETFGARDRIYFNIDLGITYDTSPEALKSIRGEIETRLRAEPKIWPDQVQVHVIGFGDSAITLRARAWFETIDYNEFLDIRHRVLLEFMQIVARHGSSFAYPTRTVHHVWEGDGQPPATGSIAEAVK
ncbi:MAG: mechanosensitive ion channel domain-containing protein [Gemmatimonadaceae bacterium]